MSNTQSNVNKVSGAPGQTGRFVLENQKSLLFIGSAIVLLVVIYFAYQRFYLAPREIEAADEMHMAQEYWDKKEWDKAIKGDAGFAGFEKIIADYSNTKAANLGYYYLGIAYLNKGEYGKAIENLSNYHGTDNIVAAEALGSIGDAYVELKDYGKAADYFKKAADKGQNKFTSALYLKKLGLVYEEQQKFKDAADTYKKIKTDYPESTEAYTIDGYIARAEAKL
jgi:tetratricopeptide (TPR) repeat protein